MSWWKIGDTAIDSAGMVNYEGHRVPFHIMAEHQVDGGFLESADSGAIKNMLKWTCS